MKQKKENRVALLLRWAGEQKIWLFLAVFLSAVSGLCIIVPYIGIYRLMDAAFSHTCTQESVVQTAAMIAAAVTLRFALFGLFRRGRPQRGLRRSFQSALHGGGTHGQSAFGGPE